MLAVPNPFCAFIYFGSVTGKATPGESDWSYMNLPWQAWDVYKPTLTPKSLWWHWCTCTEAWHDVASFNAHRNSTLFSFSARYTVHLIHYKCLVIIHCSCDLQSIMGLTYEVFFSTRAVPTGSTYHNEDRIFERPWRLHYFHVIIVLILPLHSFLYDSPSLGEVILVIQEDIACGLILYSWKKAK